MSEIDLEAPRWLIPTFSGIRRGILIVGVSTVGLTLLDSAFSIPLPVSRSSSAGADPNCHTIIFNGDSDIVPKGGTIKVCVYLLNPSDTTPVDSGTVLPHN